MSLSNPLVFSEKAERMSAEGKVSEEARGSILLPEGGWLAQVKAPHTSYVERTASSLCVLATSSHAWWL